jgi:hypothetical protein
VEVLRGGELPARSARQNEEAGRDRLGAREAIAAACGACALAALIVTWDSLGWMQAGPIPYANGGACDAWHYFALSLLPRIGHFLAPDARLIGRPMLFAPLFAIKSLLPGAGVGVISYFLFFPLTIATTYIALRALFGRRVSALACLLLGCSPLLNNIESITYGTAASVAYTGCLLACLTWSGNLSDRRRRVACCLAGVFYAWAANANLMSIEFNSFFCLFVLLERLDPPLRLGILARRAWPAAADFLGGLVAGTGVTVVLSAALGTGALSPYFQVRDAIAGLGDWHYSGWQGETVAFGLIALVGVFAIVAAGQARGDDERHARDLYLVIAVALLTCLATSFTTFALNDQSLVYDVFYVLLLFSVMLAFCAAFDRPLNGRTNLETALMFAAALAAMFAINIVSARIREVTFWTATHLQLLFYASVVLVAVTLAFGRVGKSGSLLASLTAVALALQAAKGRQVHDVYLSVRAVQKAQTDMTESALSFIISKIDEKPLVWVSIGDDQLTELRIVRGLVRCDGGVEASDPAAWPRPADPALASDRTIVAIGGDFAPFDAALGRLGFRFEIVASRHFSASEVGVLEVKIGKARRL